MGRVIADELGEHGQIVGRLDFATGAVAEEPLGGDRILSGQGDEEGVFFSWIFDQQLLERLIAKQLHGGGELASQRVGQAGSEGGHVAVGDDRLRTGRGLRQLISLSMRPQPLGEAADVVLAVAVVPDIVDEFGDGARGAAGSSAVIAGGVLEAFEEAAAEAIEDGEVGFVWVAFALASAAAEHLLEQNAGADRAHKDDDFQVGNIDAGGHEIDRDDDAGILAVAEFADALQRAIDAAGDFLDEGIASAEDFAADVDELIGVGNVGQIVGGEDERLGEAAVALLRAGRNGRGGLRRFYDWNRGR